MDAILEPLLADPSLTVVTASDHLARVVEERLSGRRLVDGTRVWPSPDAVAWQSWLQRLWGDLLLSSPEAGVLLDDDQTRVLWTAIIGADGDIDNDRAARLAAVAARSWRLAFGYGLDPATIRPLTEDQAIFRRWCAALERRLAEGGWLTLDQVPARLAAAFDGGAAPFANGSDILLAGFDELMPAQRTLIDALAQRGHEVSAICPLAAAAAVPVRHELDDTAAELRQAALWARRIAAADDRARIAIVVHDLGSRRDRVAAIVGDVLTPASVFDGGDHGGWHVSLGRPLAEQPLVAAALNWLRLAIGEPLEADGYGALLRSPWLGGDGASRARLDLALRDDHWDRIDRAALAGVLNQRRHRDAGLAGFGAVIDALAEPPHGSLPAEHWVGLFDDWLRIGGWPGPVAADSRVWQALDAWHRLLRSFASLSALAPAMSAGRALATVAAMARERVHQPRSESARIQVLGTLEAAGMTFDHVWITGLDDSAWPAAVRPDPFLPLPWQRAAGLAEASADGRLAQARTVLGRLCASAPAIVVSHAVRCGDEVRAASPLVRSLAAAAPADDGDDVEPDRLLLAAAPALDTLPDRRGPALQAHGPVRGGAGVVGDQAQCPFRAFARHRLGVDVAARPAPGLGSQARGRIVHDALAALWTDLGDRDTLDAMAGDALRERVRTAVANSLRAMPGHWLRLKGRRLVALESERLATLITDWLVLERSRAPFAVIATEHTVDGRAGELALRLRIDRIDRLGDGSLAVIDYKTGRATLERIDGERPGPVQLLLYRRAAGDDAGAIAYACVVPDPHQRGYVGVAAGESGVDGIRPFRQVRALSRFDDWGMLTASWDEVLDRLGASLARGDAEVDPVTPQACRWCAMHLLCRIDDRGLEADGETTVDADPERES